MWCGQYMYYIFKRSAILRRSASWKWLFKCYNSPRNKKVGCYLFVFTLLTSLQLPTLLWTSHHPWQPDLWHHLHPAQWPHQDWLRYTPFKPTNIHWHLAFLNGYTRHIVLPHHTCHRCSSQILASMVCDEVKDAGLCFSPSVSLLSLWCCSIHWVWKRDWRIRYLKFTAWSVCTTLNREEKQVRCRVYKQLLSSALKNSNEDLNNIFWRLSDEVYDLLSTVCKSYKIN